MGASGDGGLSFAAVRTAATPSSASPGLAKKPQSSAVEDFLDYMKESPGERMADAWLAAHGLSREQLAAMSPERREAVLKQMAKELADQLKQRVASADDRRKRL